MTREEVISTVELMIGRKPVTETELDTLLAFGSIDHLRMHLAGYAEFCLDPVIRRAYEVAQRRRLHAAPLQIETEGSPDAMEALFRATEHVWKRLGEHEPYWSVVTADQFKSDRISENRGEFFRSGAEEVDIFLQFLTRADRKPASVHHLLEIGCGVGRMTQHFASHFRQITAVDISESHLRLAQQRIEELGIDNVNFLKISRPQDYHAIHSFDAAFSFIVLQHNPPPIMLTILNAVCSNLQNGGVLYFHVPTYIEGYHFQIESYLKNTKGEMEMHCIPQAELYRLMRKHGIHLLEVVNDGSGGDYRFESCRFFACKGKNHCK